MDARWVPPSLPWYKVNTDAAVFLNLQTVGIGVIIRDHEGSVIATLSQHLHLLLGLLEAEAKAMDVAASFAWDIGIRDVIFEKKLKSGVWSSLWHHYSPGLYHRRHSRHDSQTPRL